MNKNIILWAQRIVALTLLVTAVIASVWIGDGTALLIVAPICFYLFITKRIELWAVRVPEKKPAVDDINVFGVSESELERASNYLSDLIRGCGYDRATMVQMTAERFDVPRGIIEWMIA